MIQEEEEGIMRYKHKKQHGIKSYNTWQWDVKELNFFNNGDAYQRKQSFAPTASTYSSSHPAWGSYHTAWPHQPRVDWGSFPLPSNDDATHHNSYGFSQGKPLSSSAHPVTPQTTTLHPHWERNRYKYTLINKTIQHFCLSDEWLMFKELFWDQSDLWSLTISEWHLDAKVCM